jgi:ribosomal protein S18 acetylase RimI-like enzyme
MREYVAQIWGWDEDRQQSRFKRHFDASRCQIVVLDERNIGVLSVERREDEFFLANLQILPEFQGQGLGGAIIANLLSEAFVLNLPVRLQVLKVNPARRLYERLGFAVVGETESHYLMRVEPGDD